MRRGRKVWILLNKCFSFYFFLSIFRSTIWKTYSWLICFAPNELIKATITTLKHKCQTLKCVCRSLCFELAIQFKTKKQDVCCNNLSVVKTLFHYLGRVKRICVFEHSVMTNFNCACPAIQRSQGSGFLSEGSSWLTACMSEQWRFWRDCADAQARLNLRCSHRR